MALAHDKEGFLTGTFLEIDSASYKRHIALLREIRDDVSDIRDALIEPRRIKPSSALPGRSTAPQGARVPRMSGKAPATCGHASRRGCETTGAVRPALRPKTSRPAAPGGASRPGTTTASRPALAQPDKSATPSGSGEERAAAATAHAEREATYRLSNAASDLIRSTSEMLAGTERLDPTLAAAKEVKDMAAPLFSVFRPLGRLFGRKPGASDAEKAVEKTLPWYRKLWHELRVLNKKDGGRSGSGLLGLLGGLGALAGLVVRFSGLGLLGKLLGGLLDTLGSTIGSGNGPGRRRRPRERRSRQRSGPDSSIEPGDAGDTGSKKSKPGKPASPPKAPAKGGTLGNALGRMLKGGKGMFKSLLRGVPGLGMLLAGGAIAASLFGADDPDKSPEENRRDRFSGAAGGVGALIGGAIGALGGPLGVVVGGILGDMVGSKIGEWMSSVDWSAVGQSISDTWAATAEWTKSAFDSSVAFIKDSWSTVTELGSKVFSSVSDWFSEKLGSAQEALGEVVDGARNIGSSIADTASGLKDSAVETAKGWYNKLFGDEEKKAPAKAAGKTPGKPAAQPEKTTPGVPTASPEKTASEPKPSTPDAKKKGTSKKGDKKSSVNPNIMRDAVLKEMELQGITDPTEVAMFMAHMDQESGGFTKSLEGLNYSAEALRTSWPRRYADPKDAEHDANNPHAIAKRVYDNRMGNTEPGDGYKYRGRGAIQLTGKENYIKAGKALGLDLVNNPDLVQDPEIGAKASVWFWKHNNLGANARKGDVRATTKTVNGGENGLAKRETKFQEYLADPSKSQQSKQTGKQTAAPEMAKPTTPVSVTSPPISYSPPAPDVDKYAPKDAPTPQVPLGSNSKPSVAAVKVEQPLSQNLADRNLAAVATGGIGMQQMRS